MLMLLSVHVTSVLFLVQFNNFAMTMGFYWSIFFLFYAKHTGVTTNSHRLVMRCQPDKHTRRDEHNSERKISDKLEEIKVKSVLD